MLNKMSVSSKASSSTSKGIKRTASRKTKPTDTVNDNDTDTMRALETSLSFRDEMYSIFHSLGKILHGKATDENEHTSCEHIIDRSGVEPLIFNDFLQQNYIEHL